MLPQELHMPLCKKVSGSSIRVVLLNSIGRFYNDLSKPIAEK